MRGAPAVITNEVAAKKVAAIAATIGAARIGFSLSKLWQLVVALAESLQAHREANAFLRRLENDEGRSLPGAQLLDQIVVHHHFGHAAARQAAHETGAADVLIVDLQPESRRHQDAKRGHHPHQAALLV